jgi:predicted RNase H-like HicB family nuclease
MLTEYITAAMDKAEFEIIEDGSYYGRIPGFKGLWANARTLGKCRKELQSTLEDWLLLGIALGHKLPTVNGMRLRVPRIPRKAAG